MLLESHGGAKIKFVGEAFKVVGDVGEGKNCGGAQKIHGESFLGGCYGGVFRVTSFTKSTMLELGTIEPSKTNCPLSFQLVRSE